MPERRFILFDGTLPEGTTYTDSIDVVWATSLTLRVQLLSSVGDGSETIDVILETSTNEFGDNAAWNEVDTTAVSAGGGNDLKQETWKIGAGTTTETSFLSFVRAKITVPTGGTAPSVTAEVSLVARD